MKNNLAILMDWPWGRPAGGEVGDVSQLPTVPCYLALSAIGGDSVDPVLSGSIRLLARTDRLKWDKARKQQS